MITSNELIQLLDKLGLPASVVTISIILFFIFKFDVLTLFSASTVELKLFSKERRIANRIFSIMLTNMMMAFITSVLVLAMVEYEFLLGPSNQTVFSILFLVNILHTIFVFSFFDSVRKNVKFRMVSIFIAVITFPYLSVLIAPITADLIDKNGFNYNVLFNLFFISNIFTPLQVAYFKLINKLLISLKSYYIVLPVPKTSNQIITSIHSANVQKEKWYLIHPVNKDQYLLSDKPNLIDSTKVRLLPRNELSQYVIQIEM